MVSRHEGVRECWKEKEKALNQQLEGIQSEKEGVTCELNSLSLQFEELKADFEKQMKINNEQATKVSRNGCRLNCCCCFFALCVPTLLDRNYY